MKSKRSLSEHARALRSIGVEVGYRGNKADKMTPAYKGWVTRKWNQYSGKLNNPDFEFKRISPGNRKIYKQAFTDPALYTKKGVFIRRTTKRDFKVRVVGKGKNKRVAITAGKTREIVVPISREQLALDPSGYVASVLSQCSKRILGAWLMVNGHNARNNRKIDISALDYYVGVTIASILEKVDPSHKAPIFSLRLITKI